MIIELVGYKSCPFVQRSIIVLEHKAVKYRVRYIDLAEPPDWFIDISPTQKVPLLIVDGNSVIYESAVINEFIDEISPAPLHPNDPFKRAHNRCWIEFGSNCLMDTLHMTMCATKTEFYEVVNAHIVKLEKLELELSAGPFFNGKNFSLVDAAFAPLLTRLALIDRIVPILPSQELPKVIQWSKRLLALPAVKNSTVSDFLELYQAEIWKRQGYLAKYMQRSDAVPSDLYRGRY